MLERLCTVPAIASKAMFSNRMTRSHLRCGGRSLHPLAPPSALSHRRPRSTRETAKHMCIRRRGESRGAPRTVPHRTRRCGACLPVFPKRARDRLQRLGFRSRVRVVAAIPVDEEGERVHRATGCILCVRLLVAVAGGRGHPTRRHPEPLPRRTAIAPAGADARWAGSVVRAVGGLHRARADGGRERRDGDEKSGEEERASHEPASLAKRLDGDARSRPRLASAQERAGGTRAGCTASQATARRCWARDLPPA